MDDLVDTTQMYLKSVLELEEEGIPALRARIAERLEQAGPTVSQTVARMQRDDLLIVSDDRHLEFTERGRRTAMEVMRKHRLAECLLWRVIGLDWEHVHEEACRWEHVMSDEVEARLFALLERPQLTPYGNPIPSPTASRLTTAAEQGTTNLVRLVADRIEPVQARIVWIGESVQAAPDVLAALRRAHVMPDEVGEFVLHGPSVLATMRASDRQTELPHQWAAHLFAVEV